MSETSEKGVLRYVALAMVAMTCFLTLSCRSSAPKIVASDRFIVGEWRTSEEESGLVNKERQPVPMYFECAFNKDNTFVARLMLVLSDEEMFVAGVAQGSWSISSIDSKGFGCVLIESMRTYDNEGAIWFPLADDDVKQKKFLSFCKDVGGDAFYIDHVFFLEQSNVIKLVREKGKT